MRYSTFLLLTFFLSVSCSKSNDDISPGESDGIINNPEYGIWQDREEPPVKFELIDRFEFEENNDLIISNVGSFTMDDAGNMYFLERNLNKLISLDAKGAIRWTTGQKGRGPGDFENAYSMVTDGRYLYVGNLQGARLDAFDFDGNFISSISMNKDISFGSVLGFTSEGKLIYTSPLFGRIGTKISVLSIGEDSTSVINSFDLDQANEPEIMNGFNSSSSLAIHDDKIVSGHIGSYEIKAFDLEGNLTKTITRDFDNLVYPGFAVNGGSRSMRMFGSLKSPYFLKNGYFMALSNWPANISDPDAYMKKSTAGSAPEIEMLHSLDIFDSEGKLLYSFLGDGYSPELGSPTHVDQNGFIYFIDYSDNVAINKYKLVLPTDE